LTLLFDFEWINRNYFFGLYARSAGFFAGSELSAYGRAPDQRERELLQPFASHIAPDILDGSYRLPVSDGSGRDRTTLRTRAEFAVRGRLRSRRHGAAAAFDQSAPHLRNSGDDPRSGANRAGVSRAI
jgi:ABC-type oligopeptide transport system substrate-binding subunit